MLDIRIRGEEMMEPYISSNKLVTEDEWNLFVDGIRNVVQEHTGFELLKNTFVEAVLKRARLCKGPIGVFFSGGVDSALIAWILKQNNIPFVGYTVGFQDEGTKEPEDITESKKCAEELGFEQKIIVLGFAEIESLFDRTKKLLGPELLNPISLGVGSVIVAAAEVAKADGITEFFAGLGSEELFAGYQRHELASNVQEECWSGLKGMYQRDLLRDYAIGNGMNITVHTPFLDEKLIAVAMGIPDTEKIKEVNGKEVKKYCLRIIAEELGLPKVYAWRPKRAAQYGSRTDAALDKIARKKGMTKKEYSIEV